MYHILASTNFEDWFMEDLDATSEVTASFEYLSEAVAQFFQNASNGYTIDMSQLNEWLLNSYDYDELCDLLGVFACCGTMLLVKETEYAQYIQILSHCRNYDFIKKQFQDCKELAIESHGSNGTLTDAELQMITALTSKFI